MFLPTSRPAVHHNLAYTGLRCGELARFRWEWIDWDRDWLNIREAKTGEVVTDGRSGRKAAWARRRSYVFGTSSAPRSASGNLLASLKANPLDQNTPPQLSPHVHLAIRRPEANTVVKTLARHSATASRDITFPSCARPGTAAFNPAARRRSGPRMVQPG